MNQWSKCDRHHRRRLGEDRRQCRIPRNQCLPDGRRVRVIWQRDTRETAGCEQKPNARYAIVEAEGIHPTFVDNVVNRCPVVRVGTFRHSGHDLPHQAHAVEMAEYQRRAGRGAPETGSNRELSRQKSTGPGGVDDEVRA